MSASMDIYERWDRLKKVCFPPITKEFIAEVVDNRKLDLTQFPNVTDETMQTQFDVVQIFDETKLLDVLTNLKNVSENQSLPEDSDEHIQCVCPIFDGAHGDALSVGYADENLGKVYFSDPDFGLFFLSDSLEDIIGLLVENNPFEGL